MILKDRKEAALKLSEKLLRYKGEEGVIMAIPGGGISVGYEISRELDWPLDLVMTRKISKPSTSGMPVGTVSLSGYVLNDDFSHSDDEITTEIARARKELNNEYHKYMDDNEPLTITSKTVILVDDGMTDGQTLQTTVELLKKDNPAKIVVAVPASSQDAMARIEKQVEEAICLTCPQEFNTPGELYKDFSEPTDEDVKGQLHDRRYHEER